MTKERPASAAGTSGTCSENSAAAGIHAHIQHTTSPAVLQSPNERSGIEPQPGPTGRQLTTLAGLIQRAGPRRLAAAKRRLGCPATPVALLTRLQAGKLIAELRGEGRR